MIIIVLIWPLEFSRNILELNPDYFICFYLTYLCLVLSILMRLLTFSKYQKRVNSIIKLSFLWSIFWCFHHYTINHQNKKVNKMIVTKRAWLEIIVVCRSKQYFLLYKTHNGHLIINEERATIICVQGYLYRLSSST